MNPPTDPPRSKSNGKAKQRRKKAAAKAAGAAPAPKEAAAASADMIPVSALQAAKKLAQKLGGVGRAKQAINSLSRLFDEATGENGATGGGGLAMNVPAR